MAKLTKRFKKISDAVQPQSEKSYQLKDALSLLKGLDDLKFDESVDVAINLGIDPKKSDQIVRGSTVLPHGTGKTVRVALFAEGDLATAGSEAGADIVGFEDLADEIKKGNLDFDVVIATPSSMRLVGQLGQILGPRGLMPNPKVGTVTNSVADAVKNAKSGQVQYRADKGGIIHCIIGKKSFDISHLADNLEAIIADLKKAKPGASKGTYIKSISLSTTMGPGIRVDENSILKAS